ncbi:MAG: fimbrillin family protein [Muribaculaceae bacterium]|nr:fimbrillin family protein [Muribaculaceae bacterium]
MKYNPFQITVLIICCMLCFTSCGSASVYEPEADEGVEMSFDVVSESRAMTTIIDEFSVYGDMKFPTDVVDPIVIFNKTSVVNRDGVWCYDGTQYWFPKHEHSFVAVSPSSALDEEATSQYSGSKLSFAYTMPTYSDKEMNGTQDKSDIVDIVAATHRRLYRDGDKAGAISLRFGHLLSMINFAPKLDDQSLKDNDYIQFQKLEISGLKKKAQIEVTPAPLLGNPQTDDFMIEFTGHEGNDKLTIVFNDPKIVYNGKRINLFADNDAIIMLPQLFDVSSEATVRFTYSFKDDPETQLEGTISLSGQEWKSANVYTYNFTMDKIGLNLEKAIINEWDSKTIPTIGWKVE